MKNPAEECCLEPQNACGGNAKCPIQRRPHRVLGPGVGERLNCHRSCWTRLDSFCFQFIPPSHGPADGKRLKRKKRKQQNREGNEEGGRRSGGEIRRASLLTPTRFRSHPAPPGNDLACQTAGFLRFEVFFFTLDSGGSCSSSAEVSLLRCSRTQPNVTCPSIALAQRYHSVSTALA